MISPLDSRVMDANSESMGISIEELMQNAGQALAEAVSDIAGDRRVLFVCGGGNNGGDGYVAASILGSDVVRLSDPKTKVTRKRMEQIMGHVHNYEEGCINGYGVIVDCALGTGAEGTPRGNYASFIKELNSSGRFVISADVPSGLGTGIAVRPDVTVTFHDIKTGMTEENCGTIIIADIGMPREAFLFVGPGDMLRYPEPGKSSHKGDNGKVLVIGGGPYTGAPAIAASAALRTGCDIVRIASPQQSASIIAAMSPSFIVTELSCRSLCRKDLSRLSELSEAADAVLIGPGIGPGAPARSAAAEFISLCRKPMVIDADGLNAIAGKDMVFSLPAVLTPHRGEMARLLGREPDDETVMAFAKRTGSVVLLKGRVDMITDGTRVRYNRTGCAAMTVGGTGDALAGSVAGLMSKGMGAFDAACLAAYICGLAGERAFDRLSYGMTAPDVVESIPRVLKRCLKR
ncbi:MAG: NAD(P)H-hydrate dehydratase [Candidatus Methanomethylophilaceae archaeon]|jgi:hydroxyethylthiazole kinase-like uncharacterized protein yjeF|nr:hypothetical protein AOA81_00410 [Methanomassiliicoccales archaeon RumEn M2]